MRGVREGLLYAGSQNLKQFGYPDATPDNILTDQIYSAFFRAILVDNFGQGVDAQIREIIAEIDAGDAA